MFNAYSMMQDLRGMVAEGTAKHWNDVDIVAALNKSLANVYRRLALTAGDWFVKQSSALTPVAGKITLPADCAKPLYAEEVTSGNEIVLGTMTVRERGVNMRYSDRLSYSAIQAWMEEDYLRINDDSYTTSIYLWYERNIPLLHSGTATGSTAPSLVLADDRNTARTDDYYNGTKVEILTSAGVFQARGSVTDYDGGTGTLTLSLETGSWPADFTDYLYGTVPVVPQAALDYLIHKALLYMILKPGSSVQKEQVYFVRDEVQDAQKDFEAWASSRIKTNSKVRYTGAYSNG